MTRIAAAFGVTLLLALVLVACGGGATSPRPPTTPAPSPAATPSPVATPSPTAAPAAAEPSTPGSPPASTATRGEAPPLPDSVRELLEEVAEVRGLEAPPTLRALTVARRDLFDTYVALVTEEERLQLDETTEVYRLLGHLEENESLWDIQVSFLDLVLGFYSPEEKTLWVVTDEEGVGLEELTPSQRETLVHEILHALQDYYFDLDATFETFGQNLDAELAFTAVVEGDAVVHTERHALRSLAIPAAGGRFFLAAANQRPNIPAAILRELYFPYTTGATWARGVLMSEGTEGLDTFLTEPPPATTLILHPELMGAGWEPDPPANAGLPEEQLEAVLGLGWRARFSGSLGEFHLLNYLVGDAPASAGWLHRSTHRAAINAAAGWAGDRYTLFENGNERLLVARVRFVDDDEAAQFARSHRSVATRRAEVVEEDGFTLATRSDGKVVGLLEPFGRDVIFAIGTSAEAVGAALEAMVGG